MAHDAVLYSDYFQRQITAAVSDEAIKKRFDEELAKFVPVDEPHVLHILVKDEAEAKAIIAKLDQGGDFAAMAKEKSLDAGTAANGGDLGFVPRDVTVPEFEKAAYALNPGTYTKDTGSVEVWLARDQGDRDAQDRRRRRLRVRAHASRASSPRKPGAARRRTSAPGRTSPT